MLQTRSRLIFCLIVLPALFFNTGCKPGKEARKTLPDTGFSQDVIGFPGLPFYAVDTNIRGKRFTAIYLRNADFDTLAINMVKAWEPFAPSVIKMIAERNTKGVLIDFRSNSSAPFNQSVFTVSAPGHAPAANQSSIPLTLCFVWDEYSSERAAIFINELRQSASIAINELATSITSNKQDCFDSAPPDFNNQ